MKLLLLLLLLQLNFALICLIVSQDVQSLRKEVKDLKAALEELTKRVSELESNK